MIFSIKFPSDSYWMRKKKEIQYTPDDNHLMYTNENCWKFFVQKFRTWRQTPMVRGKYTQLMRGKSAKIVLKRYHENNSISFYFKNNFGMAFEKILPPMKFRWRIFVTYQKFMIPKWRKRAPKMVTRREKMDMKNSIILQTKPSENLTYICREVWQSWHILIVNRKKGRKYFIV